MVKEMNSIGKVNFVSYDKLSFEIIDFNKLEFNYDGEFYLLKGVLNFVTIVNRQNIKFIYKIEKLEDKEQILSKDENSKFNNTANVLCSPIGFIENNRINFNLKSYPFLKDDVYLTSNADLEIIFDVNTNRAINLGLIDDKFYANFSINKLLIFHSAILGNTGSGKSTTIRHILNQITKHNTNNLHLHIFDVHKEYQIKDDKISIIERYNIPLKSLELQDWINLVKPSDLVQLPILRMALQLSNLIYSGEIEKSHLNCYLSYTIYHLGSEAGSTISKIKYLLKDEDVANKDSLFMSFGNKFLGKGNTPAQATENSKTLESDFLDCLKNKFPPNFEIDFQDKINQSEYEVTSFDCLMEALNYVFYLEECKGNTAARNYSATLETRIKEVQSRYSRFFGDVEEENQLNEQVTIYDVSELDDDLLLFLTSYICKKYFNENKNKILEDRKVNIFLLEEAHRYISKNKEHSQFYEIEIFRKIAREGRKFGCFLYLSSQRPSELSSTVLSQCNNYLLHRIKNNVDLEYISKTIPYVDSNQLKRLSYLPTGIAYVVGELFPIPIEFKVTEPEDNKDVTQTPLIKFSD